MKKFLLRLLVGLLVVGSLGVAGAEEWRTVKLKKEVPVTVEVPVGFDTLAEDTPHKGRINSIFMNKDMFFLLVTKERNTELPDILKGKYPLDRMGEATKSVLEKEINRNFGHGNMSFLKLKNGRQSLYFEGEKDGLYMVGVMVFHQGRMIVIAAGKKEKLTEDEIELAKEFCLRAKL